MIPFTNQQLLDISESPLTDLCRLMMAYGSDKAGTHHNYTKLYSHLFSEMRHLPLNILEIGIGSIDRNIPSNMAGRSNYIPGASQRAWADYFPNAKIYCCDIDTATFPFLAGNPRIIPFRMDQTDCLSVIHTGGYSDVMFDIIIDDGLHHFLTNCIMMHVLLSRLVPMGFYIIEGILDYSPVFIGETCMISQYITLPNPHNSVDNNLFVVRNNIVPSRSLQLLDSFNTDTLLIVQSIINIANPDPNVRGTLSIQERYEQTLTQILDIRTRFPDWKIILLEMSADNSEFNLGRLARECDLVVSYNDLTPNDTLYGYIHMSRQKSLGEIAVMSSFINGVLINSNFSKMIKLSGRYQLEEFNDSLSTNRPIFYASADDNYVYSVLYSVPRAHIQFFGEFLQKWVEDNPHKPFHENSIEFALKEYTKIVETCRIIRDPIPVTGILFNGEPMVKSIPSNSLFPISNTIPVHDRNPPNTNNNCPFDHIGFLSLLAQYIRPNIYVEYGVSDGSCIERIAQYAKVVHGVDISPYSPKASNIIFHQCRTRDATEFINDLVIDLAFIDADHDAIVAFDDFKDIFPRVVENGFICLHDTFPTISSMTETRFCADSWKVPDMIRSYYGDVVDVLTIPVCPGFTMVRKRFQLEFMR